ncbi:hypothetical protein J6590_073693 [Homalodisca vitripennis]|nr:hypothetical protein J6590_073693 [Homalodisca vitripennis]
MTSQFSYSLPHSQVPLALGAITEESVLFQRAVSSESTSNSSDDKECHPANPCGWAVYIPFTRTVDYFMKNTCVCPKGKSCLRTDDDLSVSAYVYRCRVEANPSESDTEPPAATT